VFTVIVCKHCTRAGIGYYCQGNWREEGGGEGEQRRGVGGVERMEAYSTNARHS
jgi:hypothetical protein